MYMADLRRNIKTSQRWEYGMFQILQHFLGKGRIDNALGKERQRFYNRLNNTLKQSGEGKTIEIERRTDLSFKDFRKQYLRKGLPVVMEGAAKNWDCVSKWTFEYMNQMHGADEVLLFEEGKNKNYRVKTLRDIIGTISSGGMEYLRLYPLLNRHPEHFVDFDTAWLNKHKEKFAAFYPAFSVFMGSKDTETKLHMESKCNMFIQIYGEKKWVIYHPCYTSILDPPPIKGLYRPAKSVVEHDTINIFDKQFNENNNLLKYIDRYETVIKPGDVLWMPSFYWHTVKNLTNTIGANYRWLNPFSAFRMAPLYMFLDLFQINPSIWKLLKMSMEDPNKAILARHHNLSKYLHEQETVESRRSSVVS